MIFMKKYLLEIIVFVSGGVVMIFELVGVRILAPHFGTSIFVWTNIIGVILGSLSLGYWLGGKVADREHTMRTLSVILMLAGAFILFDALGKDVILHVVQKIFHGVGMGSLVSSVILFTFPSVVLGMISPYAARLKMHSVDTSGETVGNLYALSTVGSIVGTFLAGFVLIPILGSTNILLALSFILISLSLVVHHEKTVALKIFLLIGVLGSYGIAYAVHAQEMQRGMFSIETSYNHVRIFDSDKFGSASESVRLMMLNTQLSSGMFLDKDELLFDYTKFYRLGAYFKPSISSALMLGGAGYSYPKDFLSTNPQATMDVVEIDPELTKLAQRFFKLPDNDPRLRVYHDDGRIFLNQCPSSTYDVVYGDAFTSRHSLPYQMTTQEAVQKTYDCLRPDGVVLVNIISAIEGEKGEFLRAEYATFKRIFPQVYIFPVNNSKDGIEVQNQMLVALKTDKVPDFISSNPELQSYLSHRWNKDIALDMPILTDGFSPVDSYIQKLN
jgi:spermidine synthase